MNPVTTSEIELYLNEMKLLLKDKYALVIKDSDKNFKFKYLYKLNRDSIVEILNSLQLNEFDKKIKSNNQDHLNEILFVWNPVRFFIDASGKEREIQLYKKHI